VAWKEIFSHSLALHLTTSPLARVVGADNVYMVSLSSGVSDDGGRLLCEDHGALRQPFPLRLEPITHSI
jgi:hypothetical protein